MNRKMTIIYIVLLQNLFKFQTNKTIFQIGHSSIYE